MTKKTDPAPTTALGAIAAAKGEAAKVPEAAPTAQKQPAVALVTGSALKVGDFIKMGAKNVYKVVTACEAGGNGTARKYKGPSLQDSLPINGAGSYQIATNVGAPSVAGAIHSGQASTASFKRSEDSGAT